MSDLHAPTEASPRILFAPVSGPRGMGEYARALALARAVVARWPRAQIHFAVSREAPYARDLPFPATVLPSSPTYHPREIRTLIAQFRPTLAIFDNAGRTSQLKAAARAGARVIFVSSRRRQRRKAFRWRWLRRIDEHWIAWPAFMAGELTAFERLKLRLTGRTTVRFFDAMLPAADAALAQSLTSRYSLKSGDYVLVVPGGGTDHPGAENAPQIVAEAARRIASRGYQTVLVGVEATSEGLRSTPRLPMHEVAELIRGARVVLCNGGDTLLQALACGKAAVAVAIAGDQARRIDACVRRGLAIRSPLSAQAMERDVLSWLENPDRALETASLRNGMDEALNAIGSLLR